MDGFSYHPSLSGRHVRLIQRTDKVSWSWKLVSLKWLPYVQLLQMCSQIKGHTFECKDIAIITIRRMAVHVMKNMFREHSTFHP